MLGIVLQRPSHAPHNLCLLVKPVLAILRFAMQRAGLAAKAGPRSFHVLMPGLGEWAGFWFCRRCWMHWQDMRPPSLEVRGGSLRGLRKLVLGR